MTRSDDLVAGYARVRASDRGAAHARGGDDDRVTRRDLEQRRRRVGEKRRVDEY